ncbi:unnamed protein product [Rotaria sp. Silwood1]|nr:unnamed protein product [Rotaria sp. Silwood1]CAF1565068.1 unnamed protein product [Rotaria sp. Silwood1]
MISQPLFTNNSTNSPTFINEGAKFSGLTREGGDIGKDNIVNSNVNDPDDNNYVRHKQTKHDANANIRSNADYYVQHGVNRNGGKRGIANRYYDRS